MASLIYVVLWEVYYHFIAPDFTDQYLNYLTGQMESEGLSDAEIKNRMAATSEMMENYRSNTLMRYGLTFAELFPVGLVMSLIAALIFGKILRK